MLHCIYFYLPWLLPAAPHFFFLSNSPCLPISVSSVSANSWLQRSWAVRFQGRITQLVYYFLSQFVQLWHQNLPRNNGCKSSALYLTLPQESCWFNWTLIRLTWLVHFILACKSNNSLSDQFFAIIVVICC